jgi:hypothetical protein
MFINVSCITFNRYIGAGVQLPAHCALLVAYCTSVAMRAAQAAVASAVAQAALSTMEVNRHAVRVK